jgi:hypothetical protein
LRGRIRIITSSRPSIEDRPDVVCGENEGVVWGSFDCAFDRLLWVGLVREECHCLAVGVVAVGSEFLDDTSGRLEGHVRT